MIADLADNQMRHTLAHEVALTSPAAMMEEDCRSNRSNNMESQNREYFSQRCTYVSELVRSVHEADNECDNEPAAESGFFQNYARQVVDIKSLGSLIEPAGAKSL